MISLHLDPFAHQRLLHRRIHSDPIFSLDKEPLSSSPKRTGIESIPSVSYIQPDTCGSYGSSYDSRGDLSETSGNSIYRNKSMKMPQIEQSTLFNENIRHSKSSQMTLTNDEENSFDQHRLSPSIIPDDTMFSTQSNSPMEQSVITSSNAEYPPMRSNLSFFLSFSSSSRSHHCQDKRK